MGINFERLPKNYQDKINQEIKGNVGDEEPEISEAYREYEAYHLNECDLTDEGLEIEDWGSLHLAFRAGWLKCQENKQGFLL